MTSIFSYFWRENYRTRYNDTNTRRSWCISIVRSIHVTSNFPLSFAGKVNPRHITSSCPLKLAEKLNWRTAVTRRQVTWHQLTSRAPDPFRNSIEQHWRSPLLGREARDWIWVFAEHWRHTRVKRAQSRWASNGGLSKRVYRCLKMKICSFGYSVTESARKRSPALSYSHFLLRSLPHLSDNAP